MTDRETALAQLEAIEDAYTRWMLARAVGCPDMEHRDAQALSSALFAIFDGGPEADDEPCAIKRALRPEAQDGVAAAAKVLLDDLDALVSGSEGVTGLHLNGDLAPWDELTESEHLGSMETLRRALSQGGK